jgi:O-antigen/teichoic acid export membrane protein
MTTDVTPSIATIEATAEVGADLRVLDEASNRTRTEPSGAKVGSDRLVQNSMFIMASTALMGVLGFAFWVVCARLFSTRAVGVASSIVAGTALISYFALLGLNGTFIAFMPRSTERDREVSTGVNLVFLTGATLAVAYAVVGRIVAPDLSILVHPWWHLVLFAALNAAMAVNLLTDSFFLAYRAARFNFLVDGVLGAGTKLALPVALITLGAFGIFTAAGVAAAVACVASLVLMARRFGFRYRAVIDGRVLRRSARYAASSYVSSLLNLIPQLIIPIVVLSVLGATNAAYFNVAFAITMLINGVSFAVSQSMFAEGSQRNVDVGRLGRRSAVLTGAVLLPGVLVCIGLSHLVLLPFGPEYAAHASTTLAVFALGTPMVALNVWSSTLLRIRLYMGLLVASNVVYAIVTVAGVVLLASRGTAWVGVAWFAGNLATSVFGLAAYVIAERRRIVRSPA